MKNYNLFTSYSISDINIHSISLNSLKIVFEEILSSVNTPKIITTFNLDFLRISTIDKEFYDICNLSLLNLPDGFGITSLIKKRHKTDINRITGNDIFPILLVLAKKHNKKIAIIGGTNAVSKITSQKIISQYELIPEKLICLSPPYKFEENKKINMNIVKTISEFKPDIVFAALGCPRQEKWLFNNMNKFGSEINIGIGATLDFFTKKNYRSPSFIQKIGFEWLWRLVNEPIRLFNRYIIYDLPFYIKMVVHIIKQNRTHKYSK